NVLPAFLSRDRQQSTVALGPMVDWPASFRKVLHQPHLIVVMTRPWPDYGTTGLRDYGTAKRHYGTMGLPNRRSPPAARRSSLQVPYSRRLVVLHSPSPVV